MEPEVNGRWVAEQLKLHHIQKNSLVKLLGIDASGVSRLLRGHRRIKPHEVPLLLTFFGLRSQAPARTPVALLTVLHEPDRDMKAIAQIAGITEQRLLEIKYVQGGPVQPQERVGLVKALGLPEEQLFAADEYYDTHPWVTPVVANLDPARPIAAPPQIAIFQLLGNGRSREISSSGLGERQPPGLLQGQSDAYGILLLDDDWHPQFLRGDLLWVSRRTPAWHGKRGVLMSNETTALGIVEDDGSKRFLVSAARRVEVPGDARIDTIVAIEPS